MSRTSSCPTPARNTCPHVVHSRSGLGAKRRARPTVEAPQAGHARTAGMRRDPTIRQPMKVCVVYDCLFPWTVGGAERWYRNVAERLAASGHEVTYLTLRQWDAADPPRLPGVRVVAVGPRLALYTASGRRRIGPPLVFGLGVLAHLVRHGRRYDVVHTASFPYFSVLAAALVRRLAGFRLVVDWHEVWTREYW